MDRVKKKMKLTYRHYPNWTPYTLKVMCKINWGVTLIKCKVTTKGWYKEIYLTEDDFKIQTNSNFSRVTFV